MRIYKISKNTLEDRDFNNVVKISYHDEFLTITSVKPRTNLTGKNKKIIVTVPATEENWQFFRSKYFSNWNF